MTKSKQDTKHKAELVSRREINRTCLGLNWRVFSFDDLVKGAPLAFYVVYVQPVVGKLEPLALQDTLTLAVDFNLYNKFDIKTQCGQEGQDIEHQTHWNPQIDLSYKNCFNTVGSINDSNKNKLFNIKCLYTSVSYDDKT